MLLNAFSVDVEDYYQVSGFERHIQRDRWNEFESRVVCNTVRILELLDRHAVRATFFVLGWVAQRFPQLVRDIHAAGHEIGSHSFWHRLVYEQTAEQFRNDLRQSKQVLEDLIGAPVTAYRAPSFSITQKSLWALEILVEEGFQFSSSIFPVYHDRYGIPEAKPQIHQITTASGSLWEFPPAVLRWGGVNLPVSGGGYFRLYPIAASRFFLGCVNRRLRRPFAFYVHPWELDPDQPRVRAGSVTGRFRHYVNLHSTERKLENILNKFRFGTLTQSIAADVAEQPIAVSA
jgi:polysaccharide deacetylase family protein (PEP-CTERM system associated)